MKATRTKKNQSSRSANDFIKGNVRERRWRSMIKTFSWRITATITTIIISYCITGSLAVAGSIGAIEFLSKIILYYLHERFWAKIHIGMELTQSKK